MGELAVPILLKKNSQWKMKIRGKTATGKMYDKVNCSDCARFALLLQGTVDTKNNSQMNVPDRIRYSLQILR
jgi:hypothetical protein